MKPGTLYLVLATALLFGACLFAAKKAFPRLNARQVGLIALIALLTAGLIWTFLSVATRHHEETPLLPTGQPSPLLQPGPD